MCFSNEQQVAYLEDCGSVSLQAASLGVQPLKHVGNMLNLEVGKYQTILAISIFWFGEVFFLLRNKNSLNLTESKCHSSCWKVHKVINSTSPWGQQKVKIDIFPLWFYLTSSIFVFRVKSTMTWETKLNYWIIELFFLWKFKGTFLYSQNCDPGRITNEGTLGSSWNIWK